MKQNKTIVALDKHVETRRQKKQRMEDQQEQSIGWSTPVATRRSKIT
jgi:hypothetical protein